MADADHPKTHVEDQDLKNPRKQPESPHREGIDPLTESDTMFPREDTKKESEKLSKKEEKKALKNEPSDSDKASRQTVDDQEALNAKNSTPEDPTTEPATDDTDQASDEPETHEQTTK